MAGRKMANEKENSGGSYGGEDMASGLFYSPYFGYDLMQNCDLPPPMKVYAGQEKTIVSPMNVIYSTVKVVGEKDEAFGVDMSNKDNSGAEKLELLKALRLSQTRAREAEKKAAVLSKEKNDLANFLLRQSMELLAYKQWVRIMELRVSKQDKTKGKAEADYGETNGIECNGAQSMTWLVAVAICMSIAGVGFFSFFSSNYHH